MKMDNTDFKILKLINDNPKLSYRKIAKSINITTPTVIKRVSKMKKNNVILGYFTILNWKLINIYKDIFILKITKKNDQILKKMINNPNIKRIIKLDRNRVLIFFIYENINDALNFMNFLEKSHITYEKFNILDEIKIENEILISKDKKEMICDYCGKKIIEDAIIRRVNGEEKYFCCNTCKNEYVKRIKRLKNLL